jgi:hypothetical protein
MKTKKSKKATRSRNADSAPAKKKPCPCTSFMKEWLARRKERSDDDLAAALLIHFLWTFRNYSDHEGALGVSLHADDVDWLGIAVPDEVIKGLRVLAQAGLIDLSWGVGQPIDPAEVHRSSVAWPEVALFADLLWLPAHQK